MVDPLGIPFLQKALGSGQLTEQDLRQLMQQQGGGALGQGLMAGMGGGSPGGGSPQIGNLGSGQSAPIQMPQMMGNSDQPGRGPNPAIMGALNDMMNPHASMGAGGNWTPGPQGFPGGGVGDQGGGIGQAMMAGIRGLGGK